MSMKYSSSEASAAWTLKCTDLAQFDALQAQAELFRNDDKLHLRNLCNDTARCASLTGTHTSKPQLSQQQQGGQQNNQQAAGHQQHQHRKIVLDYSRQRVMGETMELLFDLADAVGLTDRREAFRTGQRINLTENQPVIHHFLRKPYFDEQEGDAAAASILALHEPPVFAESRTARARRLAETQAVMRLIHKARQEVKTFTELVRNGVFTSVTNRPFCNTLVIALGGFQLGPEFVYKALEHHPVAAAAAAGRKIRFLSNVDPTEFVSATCDLDAAETLVVIIDKSFASADVMLIARTCQDWLVHNLATTRAGAVGEVGGDEDNNNIITEQDIVEKHMIAVSCQISRCVQFGIPKENVYTIWEWINPTYSLCSAAGLLPLALQFSFSIMEQVMNGAHDMDEHFFHAPLRDNIPVILGLLGVWNSTFLHYTSRAVLPYSHALSAFPAWIQHVEMSSNGKRVALDGTRLLHRSGEVCFGAAASSAQHNFFQLLHQGRVVPADFIGFMESQQPIDLPREAVSNHDELMSSFFAQPDALAYGKTLVDLIQEGAPEPLREHMVVTGNRPSSSLLFTRLDVFAVGQLMAMYEHRTAVQGFIWGLNSFDQFGTDLGKVLAKHTRAQISASRKTGASVQGFNYSTSSLLEHYLAHGKHNVNPS